MSQGPSPYCTEHGTRRFKADCSLCKVGMDQVPEGRKNRFERVLDYMRRPVGSPREVPEEKNLADIAMRREYKERLQQEVRQELENRFGTQEGPLSPERQREAAEAVADVADQTSTPVELVEKKESPEKAEPDQNRLTDPVMLTTPNPVPFRQRRSRTWIETEAQGLAEPSASPAMLGTRADQLKLEVLLDIRDLLEAAHSPQIFVMPTAPQPPQPPYWSASSTDVQCGVFGSGGGRCQYVQGHAGPHYFFHTGGSVG